MGNDNISVKITKRVLSSSVQEMVDVVPLKKKDKKEIFGFIALPSSHQHLSCQLCFLGGEVN